MIYFATNKALREEVKHLERNDEFRRDQYYEVLNKHHSLEARFERLMDHLGLKEYKQPELVIVKKGNIA